MKKADISRLLCHYNIQDLKIPIGIIFDRIVSAIYA